MDRERELAVVRRAYAKQIMAVMGTEAARVEAAFGEVRREHFLGMVPDRSCAGPTVVGKRQVQTLSICTPTILLRPTLIGM